MKQFHLLVVLVVVVFLLAMLVLLPGCDGKPTVEKTTTPVTTGSMAIPAVHGLDAAQVARGAQVYKANCAVCHGANAEGAPNWHKPGADGKYPAPPLNGTGHDWHHPTAALKWTIREGTGKLGGNMPVWKGKLSDGDIEAVIAWFQSLWPEEIYKTWAQMNARARAATR